MPTRRQLIQEGEKAMKTIVEQILSNKILMTGTIAWLISQVLKIVLYTIINKEFVLERLFGDGGMPSSHSATVTSVAITSGIVCGWESGTFAVSAILAIIVMHDAMGVRLETGKQAKAINEIIEHLLNADAVDLTPEKVLKEFVGHTPLQVAAGVLLGIATALVMNIK